MSESFSVRPCAATGGIPDGLQVVDGAVQPDEDLRALGFDRARGRHDVPAVERGEEVSRGHAQCCEAVIGELDEDLLRLLADDVHLLDARHVQQSLAQDLRIANEAPMRLTLRLQRIERKGHVGIFVVHHRTDHAGRQVDAPRRRASSAPDRTARGLRRAACCRAGPPW